VISTARLSKIASLTATLSERIIPIKMKPALKSVKYGSHIQPIIPSAPAIIIYGFRLPNRPNEKLSDTEKLKLLDMKTFSDTLAYLVGKSELSWETAHLQLAHRKLIEGDIDSFKKEIAAAADEYPIDPYPLEFAAQQLVNLKLFDEAYPYLTKLNKLKESAFSTKWLGIIQLLENNADPAIGYLITSLNYNSSDANVLYNLAGAYSLKKDYQTALQMVNRSLQIEPDYTMAKNLQQQLLNATRSNK